MSTPSNSTQARLSSVEGRGRNMQTSPEMTTPSGPQSGQLGLSVLDMESEDEEAQRARARREYPKILAARKGTGDFEFQFWMPPKKRLGRVPGFGTGNNPVKTLGVPVLPERLQLIDAANAAARVAAAPAPVQAATQIPRPTHHKPPMRHGTPSPIRRKAPTHSNLPSQTSAGARLQPPKISRPKAVRPTTSSAVKPGPLSRPTRLNAAKAAPPKPLQPQPRTSVPGVTTNPGGAIPAAQQARPKPKSPVVITLTGSPPPATTGETQRLASLITSVSSSVVHATTALDSQRNEYVQEIGNLTQLVKAQGKQIGELEASKQTMGQKLNDLEANNDSMKKKLQDLEALVRGGLTIASSADDIAMSDVDNDAPLSGADRDAASGEVSKMGTEDRNNTAAQGEADYAETQQEGSIEVVMID